MEHFPRTYEAMLREHLETLRQMAFLCGPRQIGKTTICRSLTEIYLDWDNEDHRRLIIDGPAAVAEHCGLNSPMGNKVTITFDELHKYDQWKQFMKGFFDVYSDRANMLVSGSSKLDIYRHGGDSLMGRYFLYNMHPLSTAELANNPTQPPSNLIQPPAKLNYKDWQALLYHGGFPEPFVRRDTTFTHRWRKHRHYQLFKEDLPDVTDIEAIDKVEVLGKILLNKSGETLNFATLATSVAESENTCREWVETLSDLHYGFTIDPWVENVNYSMRREPKWYLCDWSSIKDPDKFAENLIACHLWKAAEEWTDLGLGDFSLHYVNDKDKRECDFLFSYDDTPWILVEAKANPSPMSPNLFHFQKILDVPYAFQVTVKAKYVEQDCFSITEPLEVPARTFLSQLF